MKNILILLAVVFASCTKTKYVNVPIHDTTAVIIPVHDTTFYRQSLLGTWHPITNITSTPSPTFTLDTLYWSSGSYPYQYVVSGDTLFHVQFNRIYAQDYYYFSKNFDTLTMIDLYPFVRTSVFIR